MIVTDTFDRADAATLGAAWLTTYSSDGDARISGNAAAATTSGGQYSGQVYNATFAQNQYSKLTINNLGSSYIALWINIQSPTTSALSGYVLVLDNTGMGFRRIDNNSETANLATWVVSLADSDVIEFGRSGTAVYVKRNGVTQVPNSGSLTESTYLSGKPGFWLYQNTQGLAWEGGDDAVATAKPAAYYARMRMN